MEIKKINLSMTTCYLLPVHDKYMLIDTGYERDIKKFYRELKRHGLDIGDIAYLLLTHYHDDHVGLVQEVVSKNQSCRVIMHKNSPARLKTGDNDLSKSSYINKRIAIVVGLAKKLAKSGFPPYIVREKDIIIPEDISFSDLGIDIDGRIVYTPGHTDDSISAILDNGVCFCGDAAANMLSFLKTKHCVIVVEDLNEYYASWEKLMKDGITMLYPGHGKEFNVIELQQCINKQSIEKMKAVEG